MFFLECIIVDTGITPNEGSKEIMPSKFQILGLLLVPQQRYGECNLD